MKVKNLDELLALVRELHDCPADVTVSFSFTAKNGRQGNMYFSSVSFNGRKEEEVKENATT